MTGRKREDVYQGFEQGPIRPPSEADSLLVRVTRNCPWNRCRFCPVYKGATFSLRPVAHVLMDIDAVHRHVRVLEEMAEGGSLTPKMVRKGGEGLDGPDLEAFHAALRFIRNGKATVFLQDANSLVVKPDALIRILEHLRYRFPEITRITSYARSRTIAKIPQEKLEKMAGAGLNRIHIGMESGCDAVLEAVQKGVDGNTHVIAGQKVKAAGMHLSEYVMPGLGGRKYSRAHAEETARALNRINPDFIRLRTLAIPDHVALFEDWTSGRFEKCTDVEVAEEILLFLECLDGIASEVVSDHILNLFEAVKGRLPEDKPAMMAEVRAFLDLPPEEKMQYQVGRRVGLYRKVADARHPDRRARVEQMCTHHGITPGNVDIVIDDLMKRFI